MAQHDYNIANQTFPQYRADHNNCLSAILTLNSGATAPTTTAAGMLWYDTSAGVIKQRNAADSAWNTLWTVGTDFSGQLVTLANTQTVTGRKDMTGGIRLGATTTTLEHYEQGTFTPVLYGSTTQGTPTHTVQNGRYTRIGNICKFEIELTISSQGSAAGQIRIDGLPFTMPASRVAVPCSIAPLEGLAVPSGTLMMTGRVITNTNDIYMGRITTSATAQSWLWTEATASLSFVVSGEYLVS